VDIINWLEKKGEIIDKPMVQTQLLERARLISPQFDKYVIDELANEQNKMVLRLPPFHGDLNPIEHVWSLLKDYVQMNNTLNDVKQLIIKGVKHIKVETWANFVWRVIEEEEKFKNIDFIIDEIVDKEPE